MVSQAGSFASLVFFQHCSEVAGNSILIAWDRLSKLRTCNRAAVTTNLARRGCAQPSRAPNAGEDLRRHTRSFAPRGGRGRPEPVEGASAPTRAVRPARSGCV